MVASGLAAESTAAASCDFVAQTRVWAIHCSGDLAWDQLGWHRLTRSGYRCAGGTRRLLAKHVPRCDSGFPVCVIQTGWPTSHTTSCGCRHPGSRCAPTWAAGGRPAQHYRRCRSSLSTSTPRSSVFCSAAYEMRKCVSWLLKTLPGMISRLRAIASLTNSVPVPQGAFTNR